MTMVEDIFNATAPAKVERKLLEADIQKQCVDWARGRGYWARKFSSMTQRSVPDYLFAKYHVWAGAPVTGREYGYAQTWGARLKFFTEFKRPDADWHTFERNGQTITVQSTEQQWDEQQAMIAAGWLGFECNDFEKFKAEVLRLEAACCTTEC